MQGSNSSVSAVKKNAEEVLIKRKIMDNLEKFYNLQPNSEEERQFFEAHSSLSKATSKMIKSLPPESRLWALKETNPTDISLMALYLWAMKQEDYETCAPAKTLLLERGFKVPT
jgi:hypothetical protein